MRRVFVLLFLAATLAFVAVRLRVGSRETTTPTTFRVQAYDLSTLVTPPPAFLSADLCSWGGRGRGGGGGGGGGLFGNAGVPPMQSQLEAELKAEVKTLILECVDRDSWIDHGGPRARMQFQGGHLRVLQSEENHRHIESLIRKPSVPPAPAAYPQLGSRSPGGP